MKGKYDVKCDDCKGTMRKTNDIVESYQGGRCSACKTKKSNDFSVKPMRLIK